MKLKNFLEQILFLIWKPVEIASNANVHNTVLETVNHVSAQIYSRTLITARIRGNK